MRVLFVADGRSPIARNWITYFLDQGMDTHLISTVPTEPFDTRLRSFDVVPIAFGAAVATLRPSVATGSPGVQRAKTSLGTLLSGIRSMASAYDVYRYVPIIEDLVDGINPDIVHAMRLPFEGIVTASALESLSTPLLVSVWGNDFTLHATRSRRVETMTRRALSRVDALHTDCWRDITLSKRFGWDESKPSVVLPGAGGVQRNLFRPAPGDCELKRRLEIPDDAIVIINPRRLAPYVAQENFFAAVTKVRATHPNLCVLAPAMQGQPLAEKWCRRNKIEDVVRLLPAVPRREMAALFQLSDIVVSPSNHDGTPNTLLEGIACGCFPIVGAIEPLLEWIDDGINGLTCDQRDPHSIATAMETAINDASLRDSARRINQAMIDSRADYGVVMPQAMAVYEKLASQSPSSVGTTSHDDVARFGRTG